MDFFTKLLPPYYIKKKDAAGLFIRQKSILGISGFVLILMVSFIFLYLVPKISNLYLDFDLALPAIYALVPILSVFIIIGLFGFILFIFFTPYIKNQFDKKLASYKDDEMINARELNTSLIVPNLMLVGFTFIIVILLIITIAPIYTISI